MKVIQQKTMKPNAGRQPALRLKRLWLPHLKQQTLQLKSAFSFEARNLCRFGIISVSLFTLLGCFGGSTVKHSIEDYAQRLSRVLDTPLPDTFNNNITTPLPKLADSATLKHKPA